MIIFNAPNRTLTLRSPKLGNRTQIDFRLTQKRSMDGSLFTYIKTPSIFQLRWDFNFISREKVLETIIFIKRTTGLRMEVTTHDNQLWKGYILNQFEMVGADIDNNEFSIVFEGFQYA